MSGPTEEELKVALRAAAMMRERDNDPCHLAKSVLSMHEQIQHLEKVARYAERYLRFGMGSTEHAQLVHSIDEYKSAKNQGNDRAHFALY